MTTAQLLGGLRLLVGVGSWLAPAASGRTFGLGDAGRDPAAALMTRLFAVRDAALAAGAFAPDPAVRRAALTTGIAVDLTDVVATALALRAGAPRAAGPLVGAGALLFAALGALAVRQR